MPSMWTTLSRGRDGVMARGADVVRRTRETGAGVLNRAEQRASALQGRLAARRITLNGRAIEKVERRVLETIETILDRMNLRLRIQIRRLAPSAESLREAPKAAVALDAALPEKTRPAAKKRRMRIEVRDVPVAATTTASGRPAPRTKATPKKKVRPAARSTRWVSAPVESVEELAKLPVKTLLAKLGDLSEEQRRALLAHERSTKKRKSVIAALAAN